MMLLSCSYEDRVARCPVEARWGDLYASFRTVTTEARWSSRAPNVARVVSAGVLQAVSTGDADIDVSFNGFDLTVRFHVLADGPPWRVFIGGEHHIQVMNEKGERLEGVLVEIIAGANAGRRAVSDGSGTAIFPGDFVCGPITARGTKEGFRPWVGSATACGRAGNGNWGSENIGPIVMAPAAVAAVF